MTSLAGPDDAPGVAFSPSAASPLGAPAAGAPPAAEDLFAGRPAAPQDEAWDPFAPGVVTGLEPRGPAIAVNSRAHSLLTEADVADAGPRTLQF